MQFRDDLKAVYDSVQVQGSFILHDLGTGTWTFVDSADARRGTLPASTYKVLSSLIGLETGVVKDENDTFRWDGVPRRLEVDRDLDLRDAMRYSAYWYHRGIARNSVDR